MSPMCLHTRLPVWFRLWNLKEVETLQRGTWVTGVGFYSPVPFLIRSLSAA